MFNKLMGMLGKPVADESVYEELPEDQIQMDEEQLLSDPEATLNDPSAPMDLKAQAIQMIKNKYLKPNYGEDNE